MKKIVFLIFFFFSLSLLAGPYGRCIHDPSAKLLQDKWKHYLAVKKKKAYINTLVLVSEIRMDAESMKLLQAVSEVENLIAILDEVENKYFKKAFVDLRFNEMVAHPDFLEKLIKKEVDTEIKTSELKFRDDPHFYEVLDKVRSEITKPEIKNALELFRTLNLGILESSYRKSAKSSLRLLRKRGGTIDAVRSWVKDPPYLRNVPFPGVQLGPFAIKYRSMVANSVSTFVESRQITLANAKLAYPSIKQAEVDEMNSLQPPTEKNSYDDHIASIPVPTGIKLLPSQFNAIDGVVRTLWGEATSCQLQGLPQFEAIGRVIAERSLAVERSIKEQSQFEVKSTEVRKKNWITTLKNWVGIARPAPGLLNKPINHLRGLSDFGRKEKVTIHPAAQVISKKGQFSVWNSYSVKRFHVGQFHPNIPDAVYEIQGPQTENDDMALVRILCPETQTEAQRELWNLAEKLSEQIVLAPNNLLKRIAWNSKEEILFYTHEAPLPFAKEVKVDSLFVDGVKKPLRGKGRGPCNHFRLFVSKLKNQY